MMWNSLPLSWLGLAASFFPIGLRLPRLHISPSRIRDANPSEDDFRVVECGKKARHAAT